MSPFFGAALVFGIAALTIGAALYLAASLFRGIDREEPPLDETAFLHLGEER